MEKDKDLIAFCGFYCGACPKYKKGKHNCQGCKKGNPLCLNSCKVRPCAIEKGYDTCAQCRDYPDVSQCKSYNPLLIRFGEFITRTSRKKCIELIRENGDEKFLEFMIQNKLVTFKKSMEP